MNSPAISSRSRSGIFARALQSCLLIAALLGAAVSPAFAQPQGIGGSLHRLGPIDPAFGFPQWYQDSTGVAFELGTALSAGELENMLLLLGPGDTSVPERYVYPRTTPTTFPTEHFYYMATAADAAVPIPLGTDARNPEDTTTKVIALFALEASFSSGDDQVPGTQIVFSRTRINLRVVPYSGDYVLETPYKTYTFKGLVAGDRLFHTDDVGVALAPQGFVECMFGGIGPFLLHSATPGGKELPAHSFEGRLYAGEQEVPSPVTGSPLGKNFVRLTGPNGFVWYQDKFSVTGRLKTTPVPSDITLTRASKYEAPGDVRLDMFAKGKPSLQTRLPGGTTTWKQPTMTVYPAAPLVNAVTGQLSVPPGVTGIAMSNNGALGAAHYAQWISPNGTLPSVITGVDDSGFVSSMPVTCDVVVTKADYSNVTKTLTVSATMAELNSPDTFRLIGVDGEDSKQAFTGSIQVPLNAPPSKVTVLSSEGSATTLDVTVGMPTNAVNRPPVGVNDTGATFGAAPLVLSVLANDTDPDGDRLSIEAVTAPSSGTAVINALAGTITYTAAVGSSGLSTFSYTLTDRRGGFSTATVSVAINGAPLAVADTATVTAGLSATIDVLANDSDPDSDPLVITSVTQPDVNLRPVGTVSIASGGKSLRYLPTAGTTGVHTFSYTVSDGRGGVATATVSVTVNTAPVALADAVFTLPGQTLPIAVLGNDRDIDGDPLTITAVSANPRATLTIVGTTIQFAPLAGVLPVETFTYTISDGRGGSATANVTVSQNLAPTAVADAVLANLGASTTVAVLANDTDPDKDGLTISAVTQPTGAVAVISPDAKTVAFTWNDGATGPAQFSYTATDSRGGFSTAAVVVVLNHTPAAVNDAASAQAGLPVTVNVLANDTDADGDVLSIASVTATGGATAQISGTAVIFTSSLANPATVQSFTYTVSDGRGGSAVGTVAVAINVAPVAVADAANMIIGAPLTISVLANDTDANGNGLTLTAVTQSPNGTVSIVTTGAQANKAVVFTPSAIGVATFTYTVSDGNGGTATGTVRVTVATRVPVAVADTAATAGTTAVIVNVLANDSDPDGDALTVTAVTQPVSGRVTITGAGATVTYTPVAGASSAAPQTFSYTVSDGRGGSATANVTVTVKDVVRTTLADYTVAKTLWNLAGTAGFNATVTITAGGTVIATATADARGAWAARPTVRIPTTTTSLVVTSSQGGTATRAIARK